MSAIGDGGRWPLAETGAGAVFARPQLDAAAAAGDSELAAAVPATAAGAGARGDHAARGRPGAAAARIAG